MNKMDRMTEIQWAKIFLFYESGKGYRCEIVSSLKVLKITRFYRSSRTAISRAKQWRKRHHRNPVDPVHPV